jgi:hypothetical protein
MAQSSPLQVHLAVVLRATHHCGAQEARCGQTDPHGVLRLCRPSSIDSARRNPNECNNSTALYFSTAAFHERSIRLKAQSHSLYLISQPDLIRMASLT